MIAPAVDLGCGTMERNLTKLERIYQLGYAQGRQKAARPLKNLWRCRKEQSCGSAGGRAGERKRITIINRLCAALRRSQK